MKIFLSKEPLMEETDRYLPLHETLDYFVGNVFYDTVYLQDTIFATISGNSYTREKENSG